MYRVFIRAIIFRFDLCLNALVEAAAISVVIFLRVIVVGVIFGFITICMSLVACMLLAATSLLPRFGSFGMMLPGFHFACCSR